MHTNEKLTGNYRFRCNWRGKLILQVEVYCIPPEPLDYLLSNPADGKTFTMWRDAKSIDTYELYKLMNKKES